MVVHLRKHKGVTQKCPYCPRFFTKAQLYRKHVKLHRERKHQKTEDPDLKKAQCVRVSGVGRPPKSVQEDQDENVVPME